MSIDADELAQEIRHVDGENKLGAGQLAEALMPFLSRRTAPAEPVAFIERAVLDQLAKHKDATGTVASGLLKRPFGDPAPLYAAPPASPTVSIAAVKPPVEIPGYARTATAYGNSYVRQPVHAVSDEMVEKASKAAFDAIFPYLRPLVRFSDVRADLQEALLEALGGKHD